MIRLHHGDYRLAIDPEMGATLISADWRHPQNGWMPILVPLEDRAMKAGCFVMAPFCNRIADGRFTFGGVTYDIPINSPAGNMATHGFARDHVWTVTDLAEGSATLVLTCNVPPWHFAMAMQVDLDGGIAIALSITNLGPVPMPFGLGLHPWFPRPEGTTLDFASLGGHLKDARGLPLPHRQPFDPEAVTDTCFTGWPGIAVIRWPDASLEVSASGALRHLHVFRPERPILCAEPVSHLPDALNRPELPQMDVLALEEVLSGAMRLVASL